jgi:hypothetical protein
MAAEEPGRDSLGGVTFQPQGGATVYPSPKRRDTSSCLSTQHMRLASSAPTGVLGGVAWTKRLMVLTGESPTVSSPSGGVSHVYKPLVK